MTSLWRTCRRTSLSWRRSASVLVTRSPSEIERLRRILILASVNSDVLSWWIYVNNHIFCFSIFYNFTIPFGPAFLGHFKPSRFIGLWICRDLAPFKGDLHQPVGKTSLKMSLSSSHSIVSSLNTSDNLRSNSLTSSSCDVTVSPLEYSGGATSTCCVRFCFFDGDDVSE